MACAWMMWEMVSIRDLVHGWPTTNSWDRGEEEEEEEYDENELSQPGTSQGDTNHTGKYLYFFK